MKTKIYFLLGLMFFSSFLYAVTYTENFESQKSVNHFTVLVGSWYRMQDVNNYVYVIDGKRWANNIASDIKPKIAKLFGEKYYAYMDNIKKYYYFPLSVYSKSVNSNKYEISVRIKPISGKVDEAGGIVFGMKDPGNYYVLRSNVLENNCVLFGYHNGKRYTVKWVQFRKKNILRNVWHTLKVKINNNLMTGYLNNVKIMEINFSSGVSGKRSQNKNIFHLYQGKVGLWAKSDSKTYFDNFTLTIQ